MCPRYSSKSLDAIWLPWTGARYSMSNLQKFSLNYWAASEIGVRRPAGRIHPGSGGEHDLAQTVVPAMVIDVIYDGVFEVPLLGELEILVPPG